MDSINIKDIARICGVGVSTVSVSYTHLYCSIVTKIERNLKKLLHLFIHCAIVKPRLLETLPIPLPRKFPVTVPRVTF